jgi:hypothetical protein
MNDFECQKMLDMPMIPGDPVPHIHLPRTRQRWAAPPLCNEPSECWRPWPTPCPPHSRSPTASPDFWADFWPCPWWNNIRYQSPKMQETGSLWFIYNHLHMYPILWKYFLNTALTGPKYVEIPHSTRLSGECLILGRDYSELVQPKSCQGDPESTLPDYPVL